MAQTIKTSKNGWYFTKSGEVKFVTIQTTKTVTGKLPNSVGFSHK